MKNRRQYPVTINASNKGNLRDSCRRVTAIVTILIFFITCIDLPFLTAKSAYAYSGQAQTFSFSSSDDVSQLAQLVIPESLGILQDSFQGTRDKTLIIIQDFHCNYSAQKNIMSILDVLSKGQLSSLMKCVMVEGAKGCIDTSLLADLPQGASKQRVIDELLRRGLISGSEVFASANDAVRLCGVENGDVYFRNADYFKKTHTSYELVEKSLSRMKEYLISLKNSIWNSELRNVDALIKKARISENNLYVIYAKEAQRRTLDISSFHNFQRMLQSSILEQNFSLEDMYLDRQNLIDAVKEKLVAEDAQRLILNTLKYRSGQMRSSGYYSYLSSLMDDHGIDPGDFPHLSRYMKIIQLHDRIDNGILSEEIETIEKLLKNAVMQTDSERLLDTLIHTLSIYHDLFALNINRKDYIYFQVHRDQFSHDYLSEVLQQLPSTDVEDYESQLNEFLRIDDMLNAAESFYRLLLERDEILLKNTFNSMEKEKTELGVLVTGGFHTQGITRELKRQNISYFVITPWANTHQGDALYYEMINRTHKAVELVLDQTGRRLAPLVRFAHEIADTEEVTDLKEAIFLLYAAGVMSETDVPEDLVAEIRAINEWGQKQKIDGSITRDEAGKITITIRGETYDIAALIKRYTHLQKETGDAKSLRSESGAEVQISYQKGTVAVAEFLNKVRKKWYDKDSRHNQALIDDLVMDEELIGFFQDYSVYVVPAFVHTVDDYIVGYRDTGQRAVFLAEELVRELRNAPGELLQEYIRTIISGADSDDGALQEKIHAVVADSAFAKGPFGSPEEAKEAFVRASRKEARAYIGELREKVADHEFWIAQLGMQDLYNFFNESEYVVMQGKLLTGALDSLQALFGNEFDRYLPILISLGRRARGDITEFFTITVPALRALAKTPEDLKRVGMIVIDTLENMRVLPKTNFQNLFLEKALPSLMHLVTDEASLQQVCTILFEFYRDITATVDMFLLYGFSGTRHFITNIEGLQRVCTLFKDLSLLLDDGDEDFHELFITDTESLSVTKNKPVFENEHSLIAYRDGIAELFTMKGMDVDLLKNGVFTQGLSFFESITEYISFLLKLFTLAPEEMRLPILKALKKLFKKARKDQKNTVALKDHLMTISNRIAPESFARAIEKIGTKAEKDDGDDDEEMYAYNRPQAMKDPGIYRTPDSFTSEELAYFRLLADQKLEEIKDRSRTKREVVDIGDGRIAILLEASSEYMQGLTSHNMRIDNREYIIIDERTSKNVKDEAVYHEIRELYWLKKIQGKRFLINGYTIRGQKITRRHAAHMIASAETVKKFGKKAGLLLSAKLTPYHKYIMTVDSDEDFLYVLDLVRETALSRQEHILFLEYAASYGAAFTPQDVTDYEALFRKEACEQVRTYLKKKLLAVRNPEDLSNLRGYIIELQELKVPGIDTLIDLYSMIYRIMCEFPVEPVPYQNGMRAKEVMSRIFSNYPREVKTTAIAQKVYSLLLDRAQQIEFVYDRLMRIGSTGDIAAMREQLRILSSSFPTEAAVFSRFERMLVEIEYSVQALQAIMHQPLDAAKETIEVALSTIDQEIQGTPLIQKISRLLVLSGKVLGVAAELLQPADERVLSGIKKKIAVRVLTHSFSWNDLNEALRAYADLSINNDSLLRNTNVLLIFSALQMNGFSREDIREVLQMSVDQQNVIDTDETMLIQTPELRMIDTDSLWSALYNELALHQVQSSVSSSLEGIANQFTAVFTLEELDALRQFLESSFEEVLPGNFLLDRAGSILNIRKLTPETRAEFLKYICLKAEEQFANELLMHLPQSLEEPPDWPGTDGNGYIAQWPDGEISQKIDWISERVSFDKDLFAQLVQSIGNAQLLELLNGYDLLMFDAAIEGPNRFILGFRDDYKKRVNISREVLEAAIRAGPSDVKELIWHERYCDKTSWGHYFTIIAQQQKFSSNYQNTITKPVTRVVSSYLIHPDFREIMDYRDLGDGTALITYIPMTDENGKIMVDAKMLDSNAEPLPRPFKGILQDVLRTVLEDRLPELQRIKNMLAVAKLSTRYRRMFTGGDMLPEKFQSQYIEQIDILLKAVMLYPVEKERASELFRNVQSVFIALMLYLTEEQLEKSGLYRQIYDELEYFIAAIDSLLFSAIDDSGIAFELEEPAAMKKIGVRGQTEIRFSQSDLAYFTELIRWFNPNMRDRIRVVGDGRQAVVLFAAQEVMHGIAAHHVVKNNTVYIFINQHFRGTSIENQAIYHELREAYWMKKITDGELDISGIHLDRGQMSRKQAAHILASAELRTLPAFFEKGELISFDKHELKITSEDDFYRILILLRETAEERTAHYLLLKRSGIPAPGLHEYGHLLRTAAYYSLVRFLNTSLRQATCEEEYKKLANYIRDFGTYSEMQAKELMEELTQKRYFAWGMKPMGIRADQAVSFTQDELNYFVGSAATLIQDVHARKKTLPDSRQAFIGYVPQKKMNGLCAHHLLKEGTPVIFINEKFRNTPIEDEAIYHEIREMYWMNEITAGRLDTSAIEINNTPVMPQHAAHIIASAETVIAFASEKGRSVTPYQEYMLKLDENAPRSKVADLMKIALEKNRKGHYALLKTARIDVKPVSTFESMFRIMARDAVFDYVEKTGFFRSMGDVSEGQDTKAYQAKLQDALDKLGLQPGDTYLHVGNALYALPILLALGGVKSVYLDVSKPQCNMVYRQAERILDAGENLHILQANIDEIFTNSNDPLLPENYFSAASMFHVFFHFDGDSDRAIVSILNLVKNGGTVWFTPQTRLLRNGNLLDIAALVASMGSSMSPEVKIQPLKGAVLEDDLYFDYSSNQGYRVLKEKSSWESLEEMTTKELVALSLFLAESSYSTKMDFEEFLLRIMRDVELDVKTKQDIVTDIQRRGDLSGIFHGKTSKEQRRIALKIIDRIVLEGLKGTEQGSLQITQLITAIEEHAREKEDRLALGYAEVFKKQLGKLLKDKEMMDKLIISLREEVSELAYKVTDYFSTRDEKQPALFFIDSSTLTDTNWMRYAQAMAKTKNIVMVLANHDPGDTRNKQVKAWRKRIIESFPALEKRVLTKTVCQKEAESATQAGSRAVKESLIHFNDSCGIQIPPDNIVFFVNSKNRAFYSAFVQGMVVVLGSREGRTLSEKDAALLRECGVDIDDMAISELFTEIIVGTERKNEILDLMVETEKKG